MKCKDCNACRKGFWASKPEAYICIGVPEPFEIYDIDRECTEYPEKNVEELATDVCGEKMRKIENLTIDDIWIISNEHCPKGAIGINWSANTGFGQYELVLGEDGALRAYTEYMDNPEEKQFTKMILEALVDKIKVVY